MKSTSNLILLFSLLILLSCQKDIDQIEPINSLIITTNLFGTVTDEDGNAIQNANVTYKGQTIQTDQFGTYIFRSVEVDSRYNHVNIVGDGYFPNTRTFRSSQSKTILLRSTMVLLSFNHTISSSSPSEIIEGNVQISFDGKGMMTQGDNQNYIGDVDVAIYYLDPLDENIGDVMPGDLSAIDSENNLRLLESFGMVGVELKSKDGRKLQLGSQSLATITVKIPNELLIDAPDEIPLWHFDHDLGLWVEDGKAEKVGSNYVGNVSHFSFWNFDLKRIPVMISGRIVDENGVGLGDMQIKIVKENENRGGSGYTDFDGYFSGPIEKGVPLKLTVTSRCDGEEIVYVDDIGPFESETNIGEIKLEIPNIAYLSVIGDFVNCDGEVMEEGLLKINEQGRPAYFPILGGSINHTFGICNLDNVELEVIDRESLQKATIGSFDIPSIVDIGVKKVCDEKVNFASITSPTFDINLVMVDSVSFTPIGTSKSILAFDYSFEVAVLEIKYVDQDELNIELGSHKILKMVCNYRESLSTDEIVLILDEGDIIIEDVNYVDRTIEGSFLFEATVDGIEEKHLFEGNFFSYF